MIDFFVNYSPSIQCRSGYHVRLKQNYHSVILCPIVLFGTGKMPAFAFTYWRRSTWVERRGWAWAPLKCWIRNMPSWQFNELFKKWGFLIIRFVIPVVFIIKLDWSVCICLTQLYDGRDMYRIYYIKNNCMFRHFTLVIFRLRNEKKT